MNILRPCCVALSLLPSISSVSLTQPQPAAPITHVLKPKLEPGASFTYRLESATEHWPPGPEPREPGDLANPPEPLRSYSISYTLAMTVESVSADGVTIITALPDDIDLTAMDESIKRNAGMTRAQAASPGPLPANAGFMPRLSLALAKSTLRFTLHPDGTVSTVAGLEEAFDLAAKEGVEGGRVLGPLARPTAHRTLSSLFRLDLPDEHGARVPRALNDSWTLIDRTPSRNGMDLVGTCTYTVTAADPSSCTITGAAVVTAERSLPEPGKPAVEHDPAKGVPVINEQADTIRIRWDGVHALIARRERDTLLDIFARVGDDTVNPMRLRTRSTAELVLPAAGTPRPAPGAPR